MYTSPANNDHLVHDLPAFLTVEEAAAIVRVGRTCAYQLARQFEFTDGAQGLPVVRVGRQLRVPRARLEEWAGATLTAETTSRQAPAGHDDVEDRTAGPNSSAETPTPTPAATRESDLLHGTTAVDANPADEGTTVQVSSPMLPFGS